MNKTELVESLATKLNMSKKDVGTVVDGVLNEITELLVKGGKLQIVGFGTFQTSARAAREGRNPSTGATIKIPARKVPRFTPGKTLKDSVA